MASLKHQQTQYIVSGDVHHGVIAKEWIALPSDWVVLMLGSLTFVTAVISGIDYVLRYGRSAWKEAASRRAIN